ncbi:MAG: TonB-dependent receptor [Pseudomonadales bacterium]|nr:TonB-dependent receptor [Pseudomonadales bacterium]
MASDISYNISVLAFAITLSSSPLLAENQKPQKRQIEEVVVTAERQESSVQDTSISITAFTSEALDDFGIRNQSDLQNMVPATVILPYDASVRGVGRNFRSLGGDPGVATYMNNVYSEDLYTATIGSLWDIERVEILRGPQGTLYGRNAVGGAMNFIYKKPTDEFEAAVKAIVGTFGSQDLYGVVSGPLIDDKLSGRLTFSTRNHDGWVEEKGQGPDLDSGDERNIAVQLEWRPTDDITVNLRSNQADVDRIMGGADGGGLIVLRGESVDGLSRDYSRYSFGYREIDPTEPDRLARGWLAANTPVYTFTHPITGATVQAQPIRPGVDPQQSAIGEPAVGFPNYGYGAPQDPKACLFTDRDDIKGDDLCAVTQGASYELFDQQGNQIELTWDVSDSLTLKYILGLNDLLYERITDDESTFNTASDRQFYVNHEAEYNSHEIQAFWDINEDLSLTSGIFFYDATINQRGDYYSEAQQAQFRDADPYSVAAAAFLATVSPVFRADMVNLYTARDANPGAPEAVTQAVIGPWSGDQGGTHNVRHGPDTVATDLLYSTKTERDAFAAYTQGVWNINEEFTLTLGLRYASDEVYGEENLFRYSEAYIPIALSGQGSLYDLNVARGAIDPVTLQPTGNTHILVTGVPASLSVYRWQKRKDTELTWRVNLDWQMTDDIMWYLNATTGYRAGGYNLGFFSFTPTYDPEELIAYELGYKGQHLDNTLQINASLYLYDYSNIHTFGAEPSATGGITTSVLEAPGANIKGFEAEVLWLATDSITLGGNFSYTPSEYDEDIFLSNTADPRVPNSLFDALSITYNLNGNQLLNVAESKGSAYASYTMPMSSGNLELLANFSWIDKVYHTPFEDSLDSTPGYERVDLRATWTRDDENLIITGFVNNVMDEIGIRQLEAHGESEGFRRTGQVSEPRLIGLEVTYKWQ